MVNLLKNNNLINYTFRPESCKDWSESCKKGTVNVLELCKSGERGDVEFWEFFAMTMRAGASPTFFFTLFAGSKSVQKIKPTVSAAAQARSPQPSALPSHASSGQMHGSNPNELSLEEALRTQCN